jgi:hypothetical protein
MPHVLIEGAIDGGRVHRELAPIDERRGPVVLKTLESFLARSGRTVLVEAVVVEGVTRRLLVTIEQHRHHMTVRLYNLTDPEKTAGVKLLVARVALAVLALDRGARVTRTNLAAELDVLGQEART